MKRAAIILSILSLSLAIEGRVSANPRPIISIQLWSGYAQTSGGRYTALTQLHAVTSEIRDGALYGLKVGVPIGSHVETELALGNSVNGYEVSVIDPTIPAEDDNVLGIESSDPLGHLQLNLNLYPFDAAVAPFVSGGVGWLLFVDDASFGWSYGGGLRANFTRRLSARLLYRRFATDFKGAVTFYSSVGWDPENWGDIDVPFEDHLKVSEFSLALSYGIGRIK